jgi:hypothetical protein
MALIRVSFVKDYKKDSFNKNTFDGEKIKKINTY